jgi:hypothetical protein
MICILVALRKEVVYFLDLMESVSRNRVGGMVIYDGTLEKIGVRIIITGVENKMSLMVNCIVDAPG